MGAGAPRFVRLMLSVMARASTRLDGLYWNRLLMGSFSYSFFADLMAKQAKRGPWAVSQRKTADHPIRRHSRSRRFAFPGSPLPVRPVCQKTESRF